MKFKTKNNRGNSLVFILIILIAILLLFFIQNKTFTGNSVQETDKIKLIEDCGEETIIYNFGNKCWQEFQMPETAANWSHADSYCKNLTLANYSDWKLPALEELWAIRKYMETDSELYRDSRFWTSTPYKLEYKNSHAYVNFRTNYKDYAPDFREGYGVKCLRENFY